MNSSRSALARLLVVVGLCGCGGPLQDDASIVDASAVALDGSLSDAGSETFDPRPALVLEVGTGDRVFTPVHDGDSVNITLGPQGGYHIWTAVRLHHGEVSRVRATITARLESTGAFMGYLAWVAWFRES